VVDHSSEFFAGGLSNFTTDITRGIWSGKECSVRSALTNCTNGAKTAVATPIFSERSDTFVWCVSLRRFKPTGASRPTILILLTFPGRFRSMLRGAIFESLWGDIKIPTPTGLFLDLFRPFGDPQTPPSTFWKSINLAGCSCSRHICTAN
jgi:hypothetical protein